MSAKIQEATPTDTPEGATEVPAVSALALRRDYRIVESLGATEGAPAGLPLPDKPSVAVMPFQNLSGEPEQEYFADGIVEDAQYTTATWSTATPTPGRSSTTSSGPSFPPFSEPPS